MKFFTFMLFMITVQPVFGQLPSFTADVPDLLFMNMENFINIKLNGADPELVQCKAGGEHRTNKINDTLYSVYLLNQPDEVNLKLYYKNIIIEQKKATVSTSLHLSVQLPKESNGLINKKELIKSEGFLVTPGEVKIPANLSFRLFSATLTIFGVNGQILFSNNIRDGYWTEQLKTIIKELPKGARITIANIRVVNNNNQSVPCDHYKEWILVD
ncbi:MAG: hypothetical protein IPN79_00705 [Saprospiraceae bacterium]|nr:hypothetical protein [Saprospiraceae bacterium]